MPFTGSHPAAVLPIVGTALPAAALVIGAMAPDLPYYLPIAAPGVETHSWTGVVTVDLLLGLVCFLLWYVVAVPPLLAAVPEPVRARVPATATHPVDAAGARMPFASSGAGTRIVLGLIAVVVGLVVGAATHVLWDSFTHPGRWGTGLVPWLSEVHAGQPGWQWAQWASGLVGAALIGWWLVRWWRRTPPAPPDGLPPRLSTAVTVTAVVGVVVVGALVAVLAGAGSWRSGSAVDHVLFVAFTRGAGAAVIAAVAVMLVWHLTHPGRFRRA